MIVGVFLAPHARVGARSRADLQSFARKIARISTAKLRNFGAERERKTHEKRADSFQTFLMPCHALLRFRERFCRRWARVACQKCAETHRNSRDFNQTSRILNATSRGKKHRGAQDKPRVLCIVCGAIVGVFGVPRACVDGHSCAAF